jgi:hypothetical protein
VVVEVDTDEIFLHTRQPIKSRVCLFCDTPPAMLGVTGDSMPTTLPRDSIAMPRQNQAHHVHTMKE